MRSNTTLK